MNYEGENKVTVCFQLLRRMKKHPRQKDLPWLAMALYSFPQPPETFHHLGNLEVCAEYTNVDIRLMVTHLHKYNLVLNRKRASKNS